MIADTGRLSGVAWVSAGFFAVAMILGVLMAAPSASAYTVKQMGTCAEWVGSPNDRFWVLGFISGVNFAQDADHARGIEAAEIYKFITRYCTQNPQDDLADASIAFITIHE